MSSPVALAIDVSAGRLDVYRSMAGRSRIVRVAEDDSACDAVVTDDAQRAAHSAASGKDVLMLDPFELAGEARMKLAATRTMPARIARFQPSIRQVKQALDEGKLGEPGLLRIHDWRPAPGVADAALARELDLAIWLFGSRPTEVYAVERAGYLQAHLGFAGGGMALIDIDTALPAGNEYYSLSLIGSRGAAYSDDHHNMNLLIGSRGTTAIRTSQGDVSLAHLIDAFAAAVRDGRDFSPDWAETELAARVAQEVRSAASQRQVFVTRGENV